jgi:hypothetical protein
MLLEQLVAPVVAEMLVLSLLEQLAVQVLQTPVVGVAEEMLVQTVVLLAELVDRVS